MMTISTLWLSIEILLDKYVWYTGIFHYVGCLKGFREMNTFQVHVRFL